MKVGFIYEHPSWSDSLIAAFEEAGVDLVPVNVGELSFAASGDDIPFALAVNRVNVMPSKDRPPHVVFHTLHYLAFLEARGVRIVNGVRAHQAGASKAVQNGIFQRLGLHYPEAVAIYRPSDVSDAAERIGFPLMVKPNIGGSGAGIRRYDSHDELAAAMRSRQLDLGIDGTGLVQRYAPSDGHIYRVELLGNALLYAIKQPAAETSFNYCAADGCSVRGNGGGDDPGYRAAGEENPIQPFVPPDSILSDVRAVVAAAGADLGGVEYFLDPADGRPCYYDFNPYSNFVTNGRALFGFSPERRFVEFVTALQ